MVALNGCDRQSSVASLNFTERVSDEVLRSYPEAALPPGTFRFGFDLRASPQEDARQYLPFLKYLEDATGYQFELRFTPGDSTIVDELGRNRVQLAAVGAVSYLKARKEFGVRIVARGLNEAGRAEYRSVWVVSPDSAIRDVKQLRGRRIAFGDMNSTQGHLIPRIVLRDHGLTLPQLGTYSYTGSHRNCANAVLSGLADACAMQDTMAESMSKNGLLRILYRSRYYPSSGIAANNTIPPEALDKIERALLKFEPSGVHQGELYNWSKTEMPHGFTAASDEDYDELQSALVSLGLLEQ